MEDSIRWTIKVSKGTDISLRSYLAQHGLKKGDLSKFVEEAVRNIRTLGNLDRPTN